MVYEIEVEIDGIEEMVEEIVVRDGFVVIRKNGRVIGRVYSYQ